MRRTPVPRDTGQRVLLAGLAVLLVAGCGVTSDASPRQLNKSNAPFRLFQDETPAPTPGDLTVALWFVRGDGLVRVEQAIESPGTARQVLSTLFAGPTRAERADGLSTSIPATVVFRDVDVSNSIAVVTLGGLNEQVQVLAFAQIVETLCDRPEVSGVRFRANGSDVQVPRGDGSLTDAPVDESSYTGLVAGASPSASPDPVPPAPATAQPTG